MTAEVAVMNKQAIALAADSAVTLSEEKGQKIFPSASKIFTLSKYHPVGVMVYGSASIMGVPWETVIKAYRSQLKQKAFASINDYAADFISFLTEGELFVSELEEEEYIRNSVYGYFRLIVNQVGGRLQHIIESEGVQDKKRVEGIISQVIQDHFETWENTDLLPHIPPDSVDNLRTKHGNLIQEAKERFFENIPDDSSTQLTEIALSLFVKYPEGVLNFGASGVVIAGFGSEDLYPVLLSYSIEGKACNFLKYKENEEESTRIDFENNATIIPFAQGEMVDTFMTGVDPNYQTALERGLQELFTSYPTILVDSIDRFSTQEKDELKTKLQAISDGDVF